MQVSAERHFYRYYHKHGLDDTGAPDTRDAFIEFSENLFRSEGRRIGDRSNWEFDKEYGCVAINILNLQSRQVHTRQQRSFTIADSGSDTWTEDSRRAPFEMGNQHQ